MLEPRPVDRSRIVADVARAGDIVAPMWPLTSFVAVNPLAGLEDRPFDAATAEAAELLGVRTHLPLASYRDAHHRGEITDAHLRRAILTTATYLCEREPVTIAGAPVEVEDLIVTDLLTGPDDPAPATEVETRPEIAARAEYVSTWCATYVADAAWSMPDRELGFFAAWRRLAPADRRFRRLVGRTGQRWVDTLPEDATSALGAALDALGVTDELRVDVLRALLLRTPGWSGLGRWADNWADDGADPHRLRTLDLVAVHAVVAAAAGEVAETLLPPRDDAVERSTAQLRHRVGHVIDHHGGDAATDRAAIDAVGAILEQLPPSSRAGMWLLARELDVRDRLLTLLDRPDPGPAADRPDAQVVMCIDVRSEGFRRHLEPLGAYETFGFAGFFGVPVRWQPLGSDHSEARCPVLVTPTRVVVEDATEDAAGHLRARAAVDGADAARHGAKEGWGAPFAFAESAGWISGPLAAVRTLVPGARRRRAERPRTAPHVAADGAGPGGLTLEERSLYAEAIVSTIGMARFAPLVVLCGHGASTVNNPHASSLDCGACGGAPGGASARIAAAILNDPEVRAELADRGRSIPDDTWFVAAEHDTPSDRIEILDPHLVPTTHHEPLDRLVDDLATAGARLAAERAPRLPGADPESVRRRGADWAQVRPEWGLAGNAAFIAGPRSMTAGIDLSCRTFLHSYDAELDTDGAALETILTAPLVVAQWISSQYYFSTVDPEHFGAGDKMVHNPIGGVGVVRGRTGDLAVGLPQQSVSDGDGLAHDPVRLLAVVQAPFERIEDILDRNPDLRRLVDGEWITIAARPNGREPWSVRTGRRTWETWHPSSTPEPTLALR